MRHEPQRDDTSIPSRRVVVSPDGEAGFIVSFPDGQVPGVDPRNGCRAASTMEVKLPQVMQNGQAFTVYFDIRLAPCAGGGFSVSPLQRNIPLA